VHGGIADALFAALLIAVCATDLRTRRIPNPLVACVAIGGAIYSAAAAPLLPGIVRAGAAFAVGLAVWFPFYLGRLIGAGDVKFFAAGSTWLGVVPALQAALLAALIGAALAVLWMVMSEGWRSALRRAAFSMQQRLTMRGRRGASDQPPAARMPYGLAMAGGLALSAWLPQLAR
jgi:prepilin peptidase CpaA